MAFNTTDLSNLINSEYITAMISKYQGAKVVDAIFADGATVNDETGITSDAVIKAPTQLVADYDGKAKVVRVPIMPKISGSTTELGETNDAAEITYVPTYADVTIKEYGHDKATVTGKAQLMVFDGATSQALATMVAAAGDAKEKILAAIYTAGGTKAASEAADSVKYFQVGATAQGGGVFKPASDLTPEAIDEAKVLIQDTAEPFSNGLFMGLIHPECVPGLKAIAGNQLESFQLYQASSPFPSNMRMGIVGVYKGIAFFEVKYSALKVASGANDGTAAYKTVIFGRQFLAKGFVPPANLPLSEAGDVQNIPFDDFVVRIAPDASDPHRRNKVATWWFVGGYSVADRDAGVYIVSKSTFASSAAASVA